MPQRAFRHGTNHTLIGRSCHAAATYAHLPIAYCAPGATITATAMIPDTSVLDDMKYTPENITRIISGIVDVGDCKYMIKCESGMSSLIGQVWNLINGKWVELERLDWPVDMTKAPCCHRIRWGSIGNNEVQINVVSKKLHGIYKYDGNEIKEVMVKVIA